MLGIVVGVAGGVDIYLAVEEELGDVGELVAVVVVVVWGAVMQVVKKLLLDYVFGKHIH